MHFRPTLRHAAFLVLLLLNGYVAYAYLHPAPPRLRVSVLDVGQGDSILVEGPTGVQMLVDGGPDRSVLRQLPREMGIFDRTIDVVVETHPDKDHIAGLMGVFDRYRISYFLSPGIEDRTATARGLEHAVEVEPNVRALLARRGMRIHLGGGAYVDMLYPDHDVSAEETNEGSVVMHVVYGSTSFMLTGDAPADIEARLLALDAADGELPTTVLKAGHHGSKYSTSAAWLAALKPRIVAITAGKGNTYGHPSDEALERMRVAGAHVVSTIDRGTLRFQSDGTNVTLR